MNAHYWFRFNAEIHVYLLYPCSVVYHVHRPGSNMSMLDA
jgi:hypothetical protein